MQLRDLKFSITQMSYADGLALIRERRSSRYVSKRAQRPSHVNKKIDKRNKLINLISLLTPEEKAKLLEELEQ